MCFTDSIALPIIFYIVVFASGFKIDELRQNRWVLDVGELYDPWYKFYVSLLPFQIVILFYFILILFPYCLT
jgi:hypothetical protein